MLYQPPISAVFAVVGVPVDPLNNITKVIAVAGSPEIFEMLTVPEVAPLQAHLLYSMIFLESFIITWKIGIVKFVLLYQSCMSSRRIHVNNKSCSRLLVKGTWHYFEFFLYIIL